MFILPDVNSYSCQFYSTRIDDSLPLSVINHESDSPRTGTRAGDALNVSYVMVVVASMPVSNCPSLYLCCSGRESFADRPLNSRIQSCLAMSFSFFGPCQRNLSGFGSLPESDPLVFA
jgi:hypothetical protein